MDIKKIKKIVESMYSDEDKRYLILRDIALDKNAIPDILNILDAERKTKQELILDMNMELSRAHIYIEDIKEPARVEKSSFNKKFVVDSIAAFYVKYKGIVGHCFNRFNS